MRFHYSSLMSTLLFIFKFYFSSIHRYTQPMENSGSKSQEVILFLLLEFFTKIILIHIVPVLFSFRSLREVRVLIPPWDKSPNTPCLKRGLLLTEEFKMWGPWRNPIQFVIVFSRRWLKTVLSFLEDKSLVNQVIKR